VINFDPNPPTNDNCLAVRSGSTPHPSTNIGRLHWHEGRGQDGPATAFTSVAVEGSRRWQDANGLVRGEAR
jgi:hypothetical protein